MYCFIMYKKNFMSCNFSDIKGLFHYKKKTLMFFFN